MYAAQLGERSVKAKPLHGLGGQVMEIAAYDPSGTYRAVYTVSVGESIYVLHAFQKKSPNRIRTAQTDIDMIERRLRIVQQDHQARHAKPNR